MTELVMKRVLGFMLFGVVLGALRAGASPAFEVDLESGWVWAGRADVRIPGDTGTRLSLVEDLDADSGPYVRALLGWRPSPRNVLLLTLAPLEVTARGALVEDIRFADTLFPADRSVKATYRFNNYRATYRYRWVEETHYYIDVGGTLFVRDAKITVESETDRDADDDLGLVPLVSVASGWEVVPCLWLRVDGDVLAAPQGRALDILFSVDYVWRNGWQTGLGYRVLDGGADNDSVYTFATFHHAALTLRYAW